MIDILRIIDYRPVFPPIITVSASMIHVYTFVITSGSALVLQKNPMAGGPTLHIDEVTYNLMFFPRIPSISVAIYFVEQETNTGKFAIFFYGFFFIKVLSRSAFLKSECVTESESTSVLRNAQFDRPRVELKSCTKCSLQSLVE